MHSKDTTGNTSEPSRISDFNRIPLGVVRPTAKKKPNDPITPFFSFYILRIFNILKLLISIILLYKLYKK